MFVSVMIWTMKGNCWPGSYINLSSPLYLLFLILELPGIHTSETFTVSGPLVQPSLPLVGEDTKLSCQLSPKRDVQGMTVKFIRGPLVVVMFRSGQEIEAVQAPAFQGRTKLLRQDMAEGKVAVRIHQVQLSDSGRYTCYFQAGAFYNESSSDLQVAEPHRGAFSVTSPVQPIQAKEGKDVTLSCELSPKMDAQNMTVEWYRHQTLVYKFPSEDKLEESQGRIELQTHDMAEGKVTLRIQQVQLSDSGPYTCYVRSPENYDKAHIELQVTGNLATSQKTPARAILTVVFIGLFLVF